MAHTRLLRRTGPLALAAALTGLGAVSCGPTDDAARGRPACVRDDRPFSLNAGVHKGVGRPGEARGSGRPFVVVLDENHASRTGQAEMALMLSRLHRTAGLRHLALEGSVTEDPPPDLTWYTRLPDRGVRTAVALRLLKDGEVSAAEFAAMVLPRFTLHPVERESEYRAELSDAASGSYERYLVIIAATTMTPAESERANGLLDEKKYAEAIRFIVRTDPWTSERHRILKRNKPVASNRQMLELGEDVTRRAAEVGADVSEYRDDLREAQTFFRAVSDRSRTMAGRTAALARKYVNDCAPVALDIGAAHTAEVTGLLHRRKVSYAVVSPASLSSRKGDARLSAGAYDRKLEGRSVDPAGAAGAYLDGRRKPRPTSQTEWFRAKAHLQYATVAIAQAAAAAGGGGVPPFGLTRKELGLEGPDPSPIGIDLSTLSTVPRGDDEKRRDVVFKATLTGENTTLWVRAHATEQDEPYPDSVRTLEEALKDVREELVAERPVPGKRPARKKVVTTDIAPRVKAAFARERSDLDSALSLS